MGSRAVFVCHASGHDYGPGVYIYWGGKDALTLLIQAAPRMKKGDPSCSAARLCGVLHNILPENTSLGLLDAPCPGPYGDVEWDAHSHGDAGCILIDVDTGQVECIAGYLEGQTVAPLDLPG